MSRQFLLFLLSFKRVWKLIAATGFLLGGFQVLRVHIAASIHEAGEFEQIASLMPPAIRAILGPAMTSVMSFNGIVCGGYFDLGNVLALVGLSIALGTMPASEIESGFADLMLCRPIPRHWLMTRTTALLMVSILLMLFAIMAGTWIGLALSAPPDNSGPPGRQIAALASNLGMLLLCWGGVAMAFGAGCRRGSAAAITSLLAFGTLLLDYAQKLWTPLERIGWISPFKYYTPFEHVMGSQFPFENLWILWTVAMTGIILAYLIISQRDIHR